MAKNWVIGCILMVVIAVVVLMGINLKMSQPIHASTPAPEQQEAYLRRDEFDKLIHYEEMFSYIYLAKAFALLAGGNNHLPLAARFTNQANALQAATRQSLASNTTEIALQDLTNLLYEAHQLDYDIAATMKTLNVRINFLEQQVKYENHVAEGIPKQLHCFSVLLLRYKVTPPWEKFLKHVNSEFPVSGDDSFHRLVNEAPEILKFAERLVDDRLHHFCIFSDNILGTSIAVNSSVSNYNDSNLLVFHIITTETNYQQMVSWFSINSFRGATVHVQNIEAIIKIEWVGLEIGHTYLVYHRLLEELNLYIPGLFPALSKVVLLDDEVVVQKDLSPLFSLNMEGKVMGAVEQCTSENHTYRYYLDFSHPLISKQFNPDACAWEFGVNIFDLVEWRKRNLTTIFNSWHERDGKEGFSFKERRLTPAFLTFSGLVRPLDPVWHVLLSDANVDHQMIEKGAVLHFNSKSKLPMEKKGMEKFRSLQNKYVNYSHPLLQQCHV